MKGLGNAAAVHKTFAPERLFQLEAGYFKPPALHIHDAGSAVVSVNRDMVYYRKVLKSVSAELTKGDTACQCLGMEPHSIFFCRSDTV